MSRPSVRRCALRWPSPVVVPSAVPVDYLDAGGCAACALRAAPWASARRLRCAIPIFRISASSVPISNKPCRPLGRQGGYVRRHDVPMPRTAWPRVGTSPVAERVTVYALGTSPFAPASFAPRWRCALTHAAPLTSVTVLSAHIHLCMHHAHQSSSICALNVRGAARARRCDAFWSEISKGEAPPK